MFYKVALNIQSSNEVQNIKNNKEVQHIETHSLYTSVCYCAYEQ